jgi:hypothetical protein
MSGQSSTASGYISGGQIPSDTNVIEKFSFSSDGNVTDVGDLIEVNESSAGQSSTDSGYVSGGNSGGTVRNIIQKFSFSSDANATDVGDLTLSRLDACGQQY